MAQVILNMTSQAIHARIATEKTITIPIKKRSLFNRSRQQSRPEPLPLTATSLFLESANVSKAYYYLLLTNLMIASIYIYKIY